MAHIENISGVHKLADIVKKFRLPVSVRLVFGRAPSYLSHTASASSTTTTPFSPILRLLRVYDEENLFAYPFLDGATAAAISAPPCLIQLPLHAKLEFLYATNTHKLIENSSYLQRVLADCKRLAPE